jgi:hypothetical protein
MFTDSALARTVARLMGRQASKRTRGQVMILFALMLTALMGFMALGIDVGYALVARRHFEKVASICAIQGAYEGLPTTNFSAVRNRVERCVVANGIPSSAITYPTAAAYSPLNSGGSNYQASPWAQTSDTAQREKFLEVRLSRQQETFFAKIVGVNTMSVSGRAVAGGVNEAVFAMMGLEPNINSIRISGGSDTDIGANGSNGNTCTGGSIDTNSSGNNTTQIHGEVAANQGYFNNSQPPPPAVNLPPPGPPCRDTNYALPNNRPPFPSSVAWWSDTASHQGTNCTALCTLELCNGGGCSGTVKYTTPTVASNVNNHDVFLCPDNSDPLMIINDIYYANIIVSCRSGNTGKIAIENPRLLVDASRTTQGLIELRGPSSSSVSGCTGCTQDVAVFQSVYNSGSLTTGNDGLILSGGYYDTIEAGNGKIYFKDGQYLISRGFDASGPVNGCSVVNSAVNAQPCTDTSSHLSIVVGLMWNTENNATTVLSCCANNASSTQWPTAYRPTSPANTNNILIYHLGGCRSPYANSTPTSSGQAIFPIWPGWTSSQCDAPATSSINLTFSPGSGAITLADVRSYLTGMRVFNQVSTQGGNNNTWGGSLYSPYQCYSSPTPCPAVGGSNPNLPQFACNTPACIIVGGGSGSSIVGQVIAPSISINGGGLGLTFNTGGLAVAGQPYLTD